MTKWCGAIVLLSALSGAGAASATVPTVDLREAVQRRRVEIKVVGQGMSAIHLNVVSQKGSSVRH